MRSWHRRVAVALAILLALRSLVPVGYMPSAEALAEGSFRVTLCDGFATRSVTVDAEGRILKDHGPAEHPGAGAACDFALSTLAVTLAAAGVPIAHIAPAPPAQLRVQTTTVARQVDGPPLGSRAPPLPGAV